MRDGQSQNPLIDMLVEREAIVPRGPIRQQMASKEFAVQFSSLLTSSVVQSLVQAYLKGGMGGLTE